MADMNSRVFSLAKIFINLIIQYIKGMLQMYIHSVSGPNGKILSHILRNHQIV